MLSDEERREIEEELAPYERPEGACIDALKVVQRHRGWVSDEALSDVAAFLGMTPTQLDGVATFYNLIFREPVGRHVILICNSVSCWIMGYESLHDHLARRLGIDFGQTTADNRFTLLPIACLGHCDHAPAVLVDDDLYGDLTPPLIDEILDRYE